MVQPTDGPKQSKRPPASGDGPGEAESGRLPGGLYIVATPIGNAGDITLRALDVLGRADVVAAEDTRRSATLMAIHGLSPSLTPYHEHNARAAGSATLDATAMWIHQGAAQMGWFLDRELAASDLARHLAETSPRGTA